MIPTFQDGDYLITDKISYNFHEPNVGDIVIVKLPYEDKLIIKRVIGKPGDVLEFIPASDETNHKPQFLKNGKVQKEGYIREEMDIPVYRSYKVKDNEVFVMGDNRNQSSDSRNYGAFSLQDVKGKVVLELKDEVKFHTKPTVYVTIFLILLGCLLVYLFYPSHTHKKKTEKK